MTKEKRKNDLSDTLIIVPAYNEEENIERVVDHLIEEFPQYDYVVINDASKDRTFEIIKRKKYNCLDLPINLGLSGGFQAGMKYAYIKGYSYVVQIDGDGQHRPEYIESMKEKMDEGYDIVIGSRYLEKKKPESARTVGSIMIEAALRLTTGGWIKDPTSGMRMYDRKVIEAYNKNANFRPEPDTISCLINNGARVAEVPVVMDERVGGTSYLTPANALKYMVQMMVSILFIQDIKRKNKGEMIK